MIGYLMSKETRLNLRISQEFRDTLQSLADYHGLKLSSYAHSLLTKAVRRERELLTDVLDSGSSKRLRVETGVLKVDQAGRKTRTR